MDFMVEEIGVPKENYQTFIRAWLKDSTLPQCQLLSKTKKNKKISASNTTTVLPKYIIY